MAVELESKVMEGIGLGQHYSWFNGSGSCRYIRNAAIDKLTQVASENGLTIAPEWTAYCRTASRADECGGSQYRLTNVWIACSYAIQDAIYRSEGDGGYSPPENPDWAFFSDDDRQRWERQEKMNTEDELVLREAIRQLIGDRNMTEWLREREASGNQKPAIGQNGI